MEETKATAADIESVMLAVHRVNQDWPHVPDIEHYASLRSDYWPFESLEDARAAIERLHRSEVELGNIRMITGVMRARAINAFLDKYMPGEEDYTKGSIAGHAETLLITENFAALEQLLRDVATKGHKAALASVTKRSRGRTVWHVMAGVSAVAEICVLLLALSACQHGFQTLVVAGLGILYSTTAFFAAARSHNAENQFAAIAHEMTRIRKLLRDRHLDWRYVMELYESKQAALAKSEIRVYITTTKLAVMELICIVAIIYTSL